ncbi:hypothetical protein AAY473_039230 [Plecturocebus cupreus]
MWDAEPWELETGFRHVDQAVLKLLTSNDLLASASQRAGITGFGVHVKNMQDCYIGTWMNLETIILSKLTQEKKIKHCMLGHRWVLNYENMWTQGGEHHTLGSVGDRRTALKGKLRQHYVTVHRLDVRPHNPLGSLMC